MTQDIISHGSYVNDVCPLCGSKSHEYLQSGEYHIDKCTSCEFVYVRNVPSDEFLAAAYRPLYMTDKEYLPDARFHKKLKNWYFAKRIKFFAGHRRRILEIGYANGNLLRALNREGIFQIEGIDYTEGPLEYLKSLGMNVSIASVEKKNYPDAHFDIVVGLHVLEHVQNPFLFITEIHRILSRGGRVFFQVPCVTHWRARRAGKEWRAFTPPYHLWYFSPHTMQLFLSKHGFSVIYARCISNRTHLTVLAEKT